MASRYHMNPELNRAGMPNLPIWDDEPGPSNDNSGDHSGAHQGLESGVESGDDSGDDSDVDILGFASDDREDR
ncbi:hypothetical protein GLOTRDRAFT_134651 [Gloeophyllum trabeum ATCC 11539]|uniref:Uncharacterized protein n=1 Tax=Gloeophyllum trabeum (strain ATCC 11539 / FP-39264 / Madison 617) TaxID=670483 RepID=S7PPF8_GLOTA|nr:uncharacterized protein GLOTRDRAFT_134651 [Gloeophyllum trabeum ATCC 11539]EPQ49756.1 hypothetical protein GLOTRDRAFT_134651 [Gloeophyllum trabeum ATCC 11539]